MDFIKAVSIIGRDLEEAIALLDQLSAEGGSNVAEIELARLRVRSAAELLRLLPALDITGKARPAQENSSREPAKIISGTGDDSEPGRKYETPQPVTEPLSVTGAVSQARASSATDEPVRNVSGPVAESAPVEKAGGKRVKTDAEMAEADAEMAEKAEEVRAVKAPGEIAKETSASEADADIAKQAPAAKAGDQHKTHEPQKAILADRFASTGTLGEKMQSAKQEGAISSVMHSKPIADIGAAIGMNDKFYFIRELFSGDSIAYNDTIGRLNAASSLGEAMKILDESTVMGSDPSAQSSFVDVVRRKFNIHV